MALIRTIEVAYHIEIHPEPLSSLPLVQTPLYQCTTLPPLLNATKTDKQKT